MARRLGSAMISKADSTLFIYSIAHIRVKAYIEREVQNGTPPVHPIALMALIKSKKHYVGLTWTDGDKKGGFAMQCDKNEYRGVLAGLEGVTGKKAVNSDAMTVKN